MDLMPKDNKKDAIKKRKDQKEVELQEKVSFRSLSLSLSLLSVECWLTLTDMVMSMHKLLPCFFLVFKTWKIMLIA